MISGDLLFLWFVPQRISGNSFMWAAGGVSNMAGATPASGQGGPQGSPAGSAAEDTYNAMKPLYLKSRELPNEDHTYFTVCELCHAAEVVSGLNSMEGAQRIGGLWRLYPATGLVRLKLLTEGISLRGFHVPLLDNNPYIRRVSNREIDTTRLLISVSHWEYQTQRLKK